MSKCLAVSRLAIALSETAVASVLRGGGYAVVWTGVDAIVTKTSQCTAEVAGLAIYPESACSKGPMSLTKQKA